MGNEVCKNCGRNIGKLEQAFVYKGHVVCGECNEKLRDEPLEAHKSVTPCSPFWKTRDTDTTPTGTSNLKLRYRRPVFAYLRSGLGLCLLPAFLLPWLRISCNNNTIMHPSGFNLVTGIPDSKTKGTMDMAQEMEFGHHRIHRRPEQHPDFSYWDIGKADDTNSGDATDTTRLLLARIALTVYGFLLMPALVALCGALLRGQFDKTSARDPPWDAQAQDIITILTPLATAAVVAYGFLAKPSEIPPMLDMSLDWGFYLSFVLLGTLSMLLFLERQRRL